MLDSNNNHKGLYIASNVRYHHKCPATILHINIDREHVDDNANMFSSKKVTSLI